MARCRCGRRGADQCQDRSTQWPPCGRPRPVAAGTVQKFRPVRTGADSEADDVCVGTRARIFRYAAGAGHCPPGGEKRLPAVCHRFGRRDERRLPHAGESTLIVGAVYDRIVGAVYDRPGVQQMFLTKKHLSRRTLLKGAGVSLALPLLDAMIPAATPLTQTAAARKLRAGFFYIPHGAIMGNTSHGPQMDKWTPSGSGADFKLSPIMKSLEPYKNYVIS